MNAQAVRIWRVNIAPSSKPDVDPRAFCLSQGIVGVGWGVDGGREGMTWEEYCKAAEEQGFPKRFGGWRKAVNAIHHGMGTGHLVWTRDLKGSYHLGRVSGEWRYAAGDKYGRADLPNVRPCSWTEIGEADQVPGRIANSFSLGGTVQPVNDETVGLLSMWLYNQKTGTEVYEITAPKRLDLYSVFSHDDLEDVVGLYLQEELGYRLFPSTCKRGSPQFEFLLRHHETHKRAAVQVKNGQVDLLVTDYARPGLKVFLFTSKGRYLGGPLKDVVCLTSAQVEAFVLKHFDLLPERIQALLTMAKTAFKSR